MACKKAFPVTSSYSYRNLLTSMSDDSQDSPTRRPGAGRTAGRPRWTEDVDEDPTMAGRVRGRGLVAAMPGAAASGATAGTRDEPYRPQIHFSPERNWMNDPERARLVPGRVAPLLPVQPRGRAVGQHVLGPRGQPRPAPLGGAAGGASPTRPTSTSSPGRSSSTSGTPPASAAPARRRWSPSTPARTRHTGIQAQSLAYSTDRGRTWTKYAGNPVLDLGSREFRDPKVFWDDRGRLVDHGGRAGHRAQGAASTAPPTSRRGHT